MLLCGLKKYLEVKTIDSKTIITNVWKMNKLHFCRLTLTVEQLRLYKVL